MMLSRALTTGQLQAGTTAAELVGRGSRSAITIKNASAAAAVVYIGDPSVDDVTGYALAQNESVRLETSAAIWAVTTTGTADVCYVSEDL